jgi:hypothetical protein
MGENSKLGWLIGLFMHTMWADSLYFLCLLLASMCTHDWVLDSRSWWLEIRFLMTRTGMFPEKCWFLSAT